MIINCSVEIAKFLTSNPVRGTSVIWALSTPAGLFRWPRVPDGARSEGGDRREAA